MYFRTEFLEAYEDLEHITKEEFIAGLRCEDDQDMQQVSSGASMVQLYSSRAPDEVQTFII